MDRASWRDTIHRVSKSQTQLKQLNMHPNLFTGSIGPFAGWEDKDIGSHEK